jgi:DNA-binding beta-propeller fold protein YncE
MSVNALLVSFLARKVMANSKLKFFNYCFVLFFVHLLTLNVYAEYGELVKTFSFRADRFALHPDQNYVYVLSSPNGLIQIIDLGSLNLIDIIETDPKPIGMAFSETGDKLFIAFSDLKYVGVYDTQTKEFLEEIQVPRPAFDLEMGRNGILYATSGPTNGSGITGIMRIDTINMEYIDSFWDGISIYACGFLEIDIARNKLYYGDEGYPTILAKFDLSTNPPTLEWQNTSQSLGGNGQDLALSNSGEWITYMVGSGNQGYVIFLMDTNSFEVLGIFGTGAYPREACFSPDDKIFYVAHDRRHIDVWDVETFQKYPDIMLQGAYYDESRKLFIDPTGKYLFAEVEGTHLKVFDTGREVIISQVVDIDIKPRSCPNPLNVKSKGVLPVAILGSEDFDASDIDPASIRLAGVGAIRSSLEDVTGPVVDGNECACTTAGPDGNMDLTLKFRTPEIAVALLDGVGELTKGEQLVLTLMGTLMDGTPIEGSDCVVLVGQVPESVAATRADSNKDGKVDMGDLFLLKRYFGKSAGLNDSAVTSDYSVLLPKGCGLTLAALRLVSALRPFLCVSLPTWAPMPLNNN